MPIQSTKFPASCLEVRVDEARVISPSDGESPPYVAFKVVLKICEGSGDSAVWRESRGVWRRPEDFAYLDEVIDTEAPYGACRVGEGEDQREMQIATLDIAFSGVDIKATSSETSAKVACSGGRVFGLHLL